MAVKRVVMQHFSMNLALEARLRSLDEDSGLGHEPEVVDMETDPDSAGIVGMVASDLDGDLDEAIHFGHLSLEQEAGPVETAVNSNSSNNKNRKEEGRKKVTFGLAPPSQSGLAQRRLKSCLSLDASTSSSSSASQ